MRLSRLRLRRTTGHRALAARRPPPPTRTPSATVLECFDEWSVWAPHDRIARAVENERVAGRLAGEFTDETAPAGSGLAADQRQAKPVAVPGRGQRAQGPQLASTAGERKRRRQPS